MNFNQILIMLLLTINSAFGQFEFIDYPVPYSGNGGGRTDEIYLYKDGQFLLINAYDSGSEFVYFNSFSQEFTSIEFFEDFRNVKIIDFNDQQVVFQTLVVNDNASNQISSFTYNFNTSEAILIDELNLSSDVNPEFVKFYSQEFNDNFVYFGYLIRKNTFLNKYQYLKIETNKDGEFISHNLGHRFNDNLVLTGFMLNEDGYIFSFENFRTQVFNDELDFQYYIAHDIVNNLPGEFFYIYNRIEIDADHLVGIAVRTDSIAYTIEYDIDGDEFLIYNYEKRIFEESQKLIAVTNKMIDGEFYYSITGIQSNENPLFNTMHLYTEENSLEEIFKYNSLEFHIEDFIKLDSSFYLIGHGVVSGDPKLIVANKTTTSINDLDNKVYLKIFPNPTNDYVSIESNKPINKIEVYSQDGKLLKTINNISKSSFSINLEKSYNDFIIVKTYFNDDTFISSKLMVAQ